MEKHTKEGTSPVVFKVYFLLLGCSTGCLNGLILQIYGRFESSKQLLFYMAYIFENEKKVQKNRFNRLPKKFKLTYGDAAFYTRNEGRIELIHLALLKKRIKKLLKKREKKIEYIREKV